MYVIKGLKINKMSVKKVETVLDEVKKKVNSIAQKCYYELLSREIETLVDDIVLGCVTKDPEKTIFEMAVEQLNKKISSAIARRDNNEYNLACSANLLSYKNDTYIEICSVTEIYDSIFDSIEGTENFCAEESNSLLAPIDPKIEVWNEIIAKYKHDTVFNMRIYPVKNNKKPEYTDLSFNSVEVRAGVRARHYVTNVLLGGYSCGEQIPPHKLMELMDYALLRSSEPVFAQVIKNKKDELCRLLPEITEDIINK